MTVAAKTAFGSIFCMVAAPTAVVTATHKIAELLSLQPPQWERGTMDVTTHDSAGQAREFIAEGVYDAGEISGQVHYIAGSAGDTLMLAAMTGGTTMNCKCVLKAATGTQDLTFQGILTAYQPDDMEVDGKQTAAFTIKITGAVTQGAST
jgi:predicted secreted protein